MRIGLPKGRVELVDVCTAVSLSIPHKNVLKDVSTMRHERGRIFMFLFFEPGYGGLCFVVWFEKTFMRL